MTDVAYKLHEKPQANVEIVVHIDEEMDQTQRVDLVDFLTQTDGVSTAEFCPLRFHLMLVQYDRDRVTSQDVLRRVKSRKVTARLIGPI
jgi:hypothetical protein